MEINTSRYQTWNLVVQKSQNQGTAAWHWVCRDFPVSHFSQRENKRKEEPKGSVAMATSKKRTNPWGHIFNKGKEVFISSTRAQQEQTETWFNKTLILKTRTYQLFVCPLWGYTAKLTLADLADTKSRRCEGKKKSWLAGQWSNKQDTGGRKFTAEEAQVEIIYSKLS